MMASATALGFALAATHRVIDRVHHHAAHGRPYSLPATAASFAGGDVHVIHVPDLSDGGIATDVDFAKLAGWHLHEGVVTFAVVQDNLLSGAAGDLPSATGLEFDIVDRRSERDGLERKRITDFGRGILTRMNLGSHTKTRGGKDVRFLTIRVLDKCYAGAAIRIVLDRDDIRCHVALPAFEVDDPVLLLVPAANVARGDAAVVIAATAALLAI